MRSRHHFAAVDGKFDRSRRVIEKCGFVYEGTLRETFLRYDGAVFDEAMYSLTKEEWQKLQA